MKPVAWSWDESGWIRPNILNQFTSKCLKISKESQGIGWIQLQSNVDYKIDSINQVTVKPIGQNLTSTSST